MNIIVCDDEQSSLQTMRNIIEKWQDKHEKSVTITVRGFTSTEELLYARENGLQMDLLFLDILIPNEMSGMALAKKLREIDSNLCIVFVTAFSEYVFDSFSVGVLRYLRKPVIEESVIECLNIAYKQWLHAQAASIFVDQHKLKVVIPVRMMVYAMAEGHHITIYKTDGTSVQLRMSIADFLSQVKREGFVQCHRGFVVNLMYVRCMTGTEVTLPGGIVLPMGARYADTFGRALSTFYQGGKLL